MSVTIHDIAKQAGVSISTVSRVINGTKEVSPELKAKVDRVIALNDFKPNQVARGLATSKTGLVGIILSDISNTVFGNLTKGIESVCQEKGYTLVVCESGGEIEQEIRLLRTLGERQIDGVLFAGVDVNDQLVQEIQSQRYPTVLVTQEAAGTGEAPLFTVAHDNTAATLDAIRFLYENDHRRIAFISGPENDYSSGQKRLAGYKQALAELALDEQPDYIGFGDFTFASGYQCMKKIAEESPELPTAVMACNDLMAIGAIRYLEDMDIPVPEAVSVMGFDDIDMASYVSPELSTVRISYFDEGVQAAETLFSLLEGPGRKKLPRVRYLPHRIIRRKSVRNLALG